MRAAYFFVGFLAAFFLPPFLAALTGQAFCDTTLAPGRDACAGVGELHAALHRAHTLLGREANHRRRRSFHLLFVLASLGPPEPITKAAAVAATKTAYPIFFSFMTFLPNGCAGIVGGQRQ